MDLTVSRRRQLPWMPHVAKVSAANESVCGSGLLLFLES
jgi:hypothetical protein